MSKPLFRIEELIEALLKGSPEDPVYLRVGSSTYGIQAIDNGSIRVKSDKNTQDATQVVKTLRQYASGTPKGEDTGIAWRIVGVGGGTAIRSVSYDNGKIVVKTLANEGKKMDAESSPDYDASTYDPLSESASPSGYDPVTFEAPKAKAKKPKKEQTYKQKHSSAISTKIRSLMHEFDRTGMVGRSKPANRKAALNQAVAVAYSMTASTYRKSGKRLPKGVKRAEGEQSHPFDAPMGYNPEGSRPFYGNPRRLARDRWGNLRFIRRRKDGTYMDNVDFGRSIKTDRRMKAKTWAPSGFRDQGDGSLGLLTSLMGAETSPDYNASAYDPLSEVASPSGYDPVTFDAEFSKSEMVNAREQFDNNFDKTVRKNDLLDKLWERIEHHTSKGMSQYDAGMQAQKDLGIHKQLMNGVDAKALRAHERTYEPDTFGAESGDTVWVLILNTEGMNEMGGVYSSKDKAKKSFIYHLRDLGGDPADVDFDHAYVFWYDNENDPDYSIRMYEEEMDTDFAMLGP